MYQTLSSVKLFSFFWNVLNSKTIKMLHYHYLHINLFSEFQLICTYQVLLHLKNYLMTLVCGWGSTVSRLDNLPFKLYH